MRVTCRLAVLFSSLAWLPLAAADSSNLAPEYREPDARIVDFLTTDRPPEFRLHAPSQRVALLYREPVITLQRLLRPRLGLAGFRFEPAARTSGIEPLVTRVEVISARGKKPAVTWRPANGALLEYVQFSPDGRWLSALADVDGRSRMLLFDIDSGAERVLEVEVNAGWGNPCDWTGSEALLCRVVPAQTGPAPTEFAAPLVLAHEGEAAPVRTYANMLRNAWDDAQFDYYFTVELAHVGIDGSQRRVPGLNGLIEKFEASPDGAYAVITRIERPYSRLLPARYYPSVVEVWDLAEGKKLYESRSDAEEVGDEDREPPRRAAWKAGTPVALGYIEAARDADGKRLYRWMEFAAPFTGAQREVARSSKVIRRFGWSSAGTPWYTTSGQDGKGVTVYAAVDGAMQQIWSGTTTNDYDNPGRALSADGADGAVLEAGGWIFLAGDGESEDGPQPFLDAFDLKSGKTRRVFEAERGVFERVLGMLDPATESFVTVRETATDAPRLFLRSGSKRTALMAQANPYPQLAGATRRILNYERADGLALSGTLYLPANYRKGKPLPTLVWIYPYEFTDRAEAEQLDLRLFRYHQVKGPSPLAAVVAGYAVLMNPTVPIMYEGSNVNEGYLSQLTSSLDAAVDYLVSLGVTDPARVAVAGRSYGSFSSANLLIHSDRFATAVCMSGAYNRTLTPFGFQHEHRSFWDAGEMYAEISPFFQADKVTKPILLIHGGGDPNPGTPPMQARRFVHALIGQGATVRYVELPEEGHHYWARENVLLAAAEMLDWLDATIGSQRPDVRGQ